MVDTTPFVRAVSTLIDDGERTLYLYYSFKYLVYILLDI